MRDSIKINFVYFTDSCARFINLFTANVVAYNQIQQQFKSSFQTSTDRGLNPVKAFVSPGVVEKG